MNHSLKDMDGRELKLGHIVAVRYVWNSYAGVIRMQGLSMHEFKRGGGIAKYHPIESKNTYQILGHIDAAHPDYNEEIIKWMEVENETPCPIKVRIYEKFAEEMERFKTKTT